jgi:hypothetical protein
MVEGVPHKISKIEILPVMHRAGSIPSGTVIISYEPLTPA